MAVPVVPAWQEALPEGAGLVNFCVTGVPLWVFCRLHNALQSCSGDSKTHPHTNKALFHRGYYLRSQCHAGADLLALSSHRCAVDRNRFCYFPPWVWAVSAVLKDQRVPCRTKIFQGIAFSWIWRARHQEHNFFSWQFRFRGLLDPKLCLHFRKFDKGAFKRAT